MHTRILEKKTEAAWHGTHSSLVYSIDGRPADHNEEVVVAGWLSPSPVGITLIHLCYPLSDEVTSAAILLRKVAHSLVVHSLNLEWRGRF